MRHAPLALLIATLGAGAAWACECKAGSPESKIETTDAIFEATVDSIGEDEGAGDFLVKVTVGRRWKGAVAGTTTLRARTGKACGYSFSPSKTYLVFAMRDGSSFRVTTCGLTRPIDKAGDVIAKLPAPLK